MVDAERPDKLRVAAAHCVALARRARTLADRVAGRDHLHVAERARLGGLARLAAETSDALRRLADASLRQP